MKTEKNMKFDELVKLMQTLRSKEGCVWDKEQTHESLVKYLREETEELIENIENRISEKQNKI